MKFFLLIYFSIITLSSLELNLLQHKMIFSSFDKKFILLRHVRS